MEQVNILKGKKTEAKSRFSPGLNKITLIIFDGFAFITALTIARLLTNTDVHSQQDIFLQMLIFFTTGLIAILWFWGSSRHYTYRKPFWDEIRDIMITLSAMALISVSISSIIEHEYSVSLWAFEWVCSFVAIPLFRNGCKIFLNKINVWKMPCVIIGDAKNAHDVFKAVYSELSTGYEIQAIVSGSESNDSVNSKLEGIDYLTKTEFLTRLDEFHKVFIALEQNQEVLRDLWIRELTKQGLRNISIVPTLRGVPLYGMDVSHFFSHEVMMLRIKNNLPRKSSRIVKRSFDIIISALLLLLLSPLFVYISWKVSRDGGSITYGHERIGIYGKKFKCMKFRSMVMNSKEVLEDLLSSDAMAKDEWEREFKLKDDPRITSIGAFLRKTSLDELPQLWNVLKGDMSLVGPRPVIDEELERYGDDVDYYLIAKPGISGLWQVSGRSDTDYDTRVYLDSWYVKNWSLWYDIVILFKTIGVVLKREGAY